MSAPIEKQHSVLENLQAEVAPEASGALQFLTKNAKKIALFLVAAVIVVSASALYSWNAAKNLRAEQSALGRIIVTTTGEARLAALQEMQKTASSDMQVAVLLEVANNAAALQNHAVAVSAWEEIVAKSAEKQFARLGYAVALQNAGKAKEAVAVLDSSLASANKLEKPVILRALAEAAVEAGDKEKAVASFEAMKEGLPESSQAYLAYRILHCKTQK